MCGDPAVVVEAIDCWQWRSGHWKQHSFLFLFFLFFFSGVYFSHRRSAQIKKLIKQKLTGPLVAIFCFLSFHRRNSRIKKLILQKVIGGSNNLRLHHIPDPICHFGSPGGHFGFSRRRGVQDGAELQAVSKCPKGTTNYINKRITNRVTYITWDRSIIKLKRY